MNVGLEMARCSSSFLRPRLTDLIANPLQTELHPLQMPKRNVITAHGSLDQGGHLERPLSSPSPVRAARSLSIALALEGC